jgi:acetyl esterase/lipase
MNKLLTYSIFAFLLFSCDSSDANDSMPAPTFQKEMHDVSYGENPQQTIDIYLPERRKTNITKVFLLVRGGGWSEGDKSDLNFIVTQLKTKFPNHAIANINYRLGATESIGYPKQIQDIQAAVGFLNDHKNEYNLSKQYAMIGVSAGAHLAMMYSYKYNTAKQVKVVCSLVGPAYFSDPQYEGNELFQSGLKYFVGDYPTYDSNPALYNEISPVNYIQLLAPKTILFYAADDSLVPNTQDGIFCDKLNLRLVYNEYYLYEDFGHATWSV